MLGVERILVALSEHEGAGFVLEKAVTLANAANASLEVINVVYESLADLPVQAVEKNQMLKTFILSAAESWLEDQLDGIRHKVKTLDSATLWNKDEWQGILHAAEVGNSDLIIKATNLAEDQAFSLRTPQDWNLLRHSTIPVMLAKPQAWVKAPIILAAVDALNEEQFELSKQVLLEADHLASILGGELAIVCSYPLLEPWAGQAAVGIDFQQLKDGIERVARRAIAKLTDATNVSFNYLYIEEGRPAMRLRSQADETQAEILVMGTVGRSGVKSFVIGNTSETILQHTRCDVVVLR